MAGLRHCWLGFVEVNRRNGKGALETGEERTKEKNKGCKVAEE